MADKDYNIDINIQAQYNQVEQLNKVLEQTKKQLSGLSKGRIDFDFKKVLKNSTDPIKTATDALNKAISDYNKALTPETQQTAGQQLKNIIKTIEHTKELRAATEEVTQAYQRQESIRNAQIAEQERQASSYRQVMYAIGQASNQLQQFMLSLDPVKQKMAELNKKMEETQAEFISLKLAGESTKGAEKSIAKIKAQMDKLQESTQKSSSWFGKLMGRIRNISIYRAIRSGIKWLTSGVSEGLQGLAQYNSEVNSSMSNINNSLNQVRNTLAVSFASVLQALEPIITQLSGMLVDLINSFNLAMAKMQGKNAYTKAKKATDDYAKSAEKARKLSFDTFEVLSGGDNKTAAKDLFEEGSVTEDANEFSKTFEEIFKIISKIWEVAKKIIDYLIDSGIVSSILSIVSPLLEVVSILLDYMKPALMWIADFIETIAQQISSALSFIGALLKLLTGDFEGAGKAILKALAQLANGFVNSLIDSVNVVILMINAMLKPIDWIASLFGAKANTVAIPKIPHVHIGGYETGGIPNKSELFYMNENGVPEALVNTGGSQTNVINIDQLSEGMRRGFIQAIYDTNLIGAIREQSGTILMVDKDVLGSTVASSAGFRNEANRRNANLNFR